MGSIERVRTTYVVKNYPKLDEKEAAEAKKVDVEVTNPKNCVAFEKCLGGVFDILLDDESAQFRDLEPCKRAFMSIEASKCENIGIKFSQCHQNLSLNDCTNVSVEITGKIGTIELASCKNCKIYFTGYEDGEKPNVQILHTKSDSTKLFLPYKDKYGENMRELALPTRIISVFDSSSKIISKVDETA